MTGINEAINIRLRAEGIDSTAKSMDRQQSSKEAWLNQVIKTVEGHDKRSRIVYVD